MDEALASQHCRHVEQSVSSAPKADGAGVQRLRRACVSRERQALAQDALEAQHLRSTHRRRLQQHIPAWALHLLEQSYSQRDHQGALQAEWFQVSVANKNIRVLQGMGMYQERPSVHGGVVREPSNLACGYEWRCWWRPALLFLCLLCLPLLPSSGRSDESVDGCRLRGSAHQHG